MSTKHISINSGIIGVAIEKPTKSNRIKVMLNGNHIGHTEVLMKSADNTIGPGRLVAMNERGEVIGCVGMKGQHIYTVTTMKLGYYVYKKGLHKNKRYLAIKCSRTVGWYSDLKEAINLVRHNSCNIYKNGYYPWILIEEVSEGIYPSIFEEKWFKWKGSRDNGKYCLTKQPTTFKHVVNFGIG